MQLIVYFYIFIFLLSVKKVGWFGWLVAPRMPRKSLNSLTCRLEKFIRRYNNDTGKVQVVLSLFFCLIRGKWMGESLFFLAM